MGTSEFAVAGAQRAALSFDLIVATTGERPICLATLLGSVAAQETELVRVILVDQSPGTGVKELVRGFESELDILYLRSKRGLSRARNVGLRHIDADVIAFPDDDCWYPKGLLEAVGTRLWSESWLDGVSGRAVDEFGASTAARWKSAGGLINRRSVWNTAISFGLFLRASVVSAIGGFDESLGLGAGTLWGSAEETDFVLRALELGARIAYEPSLVIGHPSKERWSGDLNLGRSYGRGMGAVLRKHGYARVAVARHIARPIAGAVMSLSLGRVLEARFRANVAVGRAQGYLGARG